MSYPQWSFSWIAIDVMAWMSNHITYETTDAITYPCLCPCLSSHNVMLVRDPWQQSICIVNTLRQRQNGNHFRNDIFKCIFLNENVCILIRISMKSVQWVSIDNRPALVQIMAWCLTKVVWALALNWLLTKCHRTSSMRCQHWFR